MNEQQVFNKWYLWNAEADASHEKKIPFIIFNLKSLNPYDILMKYDKYPNKNHSKNNT